MQVTETFKTIISDHLQGLAVSDPLFDETLKKPAKNINDCITYILNEVKKTGKNGFADEEIFKMAVHYYDEDNIDVGKPTNGRVVVNHHVEALKKQITNLPAPDTRKINKKLAKEQAPVQQVSFF